MPYIDTVFGASSREGFNLFNRDIAGAFGDFSDKEAFGLGEDFFGFGARDDEGHADAHVEDLIHLGFGDFSAILNEAENLGNFPGVFADSAAAGFGEDAGEVVE